MKKLKTTEKQLDEALSKMKELQTKINDLEEEVGWFLWLFLRFEDFDLDLWPKGKEAKTWKSHVKLINLKHDKDMMVNNTNVF